MEDFKDNKCRICKIIFCCKLCREKHETNKHNTFRECEICINGRTVLKEPSLDLITHLQVAHWPLHCVFCKKVYGSAEELLKLEKCPIGHKIVEDEKGTYSPLQSCKEHTYESPPLPMLYPNGHQANKNPNLFSLATSTPMQKGEENNLFEKMRGITPVDYSGINKESIIKKKRIDSNRSDSLKKVTFSDTPLAESNRKQTNMLKKEPYQHENTIFSTPSSLGTTFYSVMEEAPQENAEVDENKQPINQTQNNSPEIIKPHIDAKADENNEKSNDQLQNVIPTVITNINTADIKTEDTPNKENTPVKQDESATWVSAIDISPSEVTNEKNPASPKINLYTPVASTVGKFKKRQVNIVLPTPIVKKEEISLTVDLSLPLGSELARNDGESPAILKPNTNTVHNNEENTPPISKIEDVGNANQHENSNVEEAISENGTEGDAATSTVQGRFWLIMNKVTSAIGQGFSSVNESGEFSLKRSFTDSDLLNMPPAKRCKLTEVKCRRTIRNLPNIEITRDDTRIVYAAQGMKVFVDKATQTDE